MRRNGKKWKEAGRNWNKERKKTGRKKNRKKTERSLNANIS